MESRRKTSVLPLVLFCVLMTLLVLKVWNVMKMVPLQPFQAPSQVFAPAEAPSDVDPNSVRLIAQLAPPPSNPLAAAPGAYADCKELPEEEEEEEGPLEFCEQASGIDMKNYVTPKCSGNCGPISGTSVTLTDSYILSVNNSVETLPNTINGFEYLIKQNSNEIHFLYGVKGGFIGLLQDTIWGGAGSTPDGMFYCDGSNDQAFYRVYDQDGSWGNKGYPVSASCGQETSNTGYLRS